MERFTAKLCCIHRTAVSQDVPSGHGTRTKQVSMRRSDIRPRTASVRLLLDQSTPGGAGSGVGFPWWSGAGLNPDRLLFSSYSRLYLGRPSVLSFHRFAARTK